MKIAICIICGGNKKHPAAKCARCGFAPKSDEEMAESLMLSHFYEIDGEYRGKSNTELLAIGEQVAVGTYRFDEEEVQAVVAAAKEALDLPPLSEMVIDLLRWLGPPIAVIVVALYLYFRK